MNHQLQIINFDNKNTFLNQVIFFKSRLSVTPNIGKDEKTRFPLRVDDVNTITFPLVHVLTHPDVQVGASETGTSSRQELQHDLLLHFKDI